MNDLGLDISKIVSWFKHEHEMPYVLIRISAETADSWASMLADPVRRCYISDALLEANAHRTGQPRAVVLAAKLPDPGSTMSGDFGEILVALYHAVHEFPSLVIGPKKWSLKQDRTKPAPYSDVVHFVLPSWPESSSDDRVLCSEVKAKATSGASVPIESAIADCERDRVSRLVKTLVWLRERAMHEDLGDISIAHLTRFINLTDHPPARKQFRAVAVVCASLVEGELIGAPEETPADYTLVVVAVPDLKRRYEEIFRAALATVADTKGTP